MGTREAIGQPASIFDIEGIVKLVDRPPGTTEETPIFHIHPLGGGLDIEARPDKDGKFELNSVRSGLYSLIFPVPGRIQTFANGSRKLAPDGFELAQSSTNSLLLIVSMKEGDVYVTVRDFPTGRGNVVALLAPADTHLTLRDSCVLNQLSGPQTKFGFVPPGRYRIFVFDAQFAQDVAAYAPRLPIFLRNKATSVEVTDKGKTEAKATYLDDETIKEAVRQANLLYPKH